MTSSLSLALPGIRQEPGQMRRLMLALTLVAVLTAGVTLRVWWVNTHHCTFTVERVCGADRYLPMLPKGI